jgi:hypothetical protein
MYQSGAMRTKVNKRKPMWTKVNQTPKILIYIIVLKIAYYWSCIGKGLLSMGLLFSVSVKNMVLKTVSKSAFK